MTNLPVMVVAFAFAASVVVAVVAQIVSRQHDARLLTKQFEGLKSVWPWGDKAAWRFLACFPLWSISAVLMMFGALVAVLVGDPKDPNRVRGTFEWWLAVVPLFSGVAVLALAVLMVLIGLPMIFIPRQYRERREIREAFGRK